MNLIHLSRTGFEILLRKCRYGLAMLLLSAAIAAPAQNLVLQFDPTASTVHFSLDAALHTVHGTFQLKAGKLQFDPASGRVVGEIVVDAKSGDSGNGMRDRKMHKEVLESERYPEILFRFNHIEGAVAARGKSSIKVNGVFSVHGTDHEITVPTEVDMSGAHWTASAHFTIPYAKWGIKNPSTFFLHVSDAVEIDVVAAGNLTNPGATLPTPAQ
jgi:polyisoprenoid-binding protein YceI